MRMIHVDSVANCLKVFRHWRRCWRKSPEHLGKVLLPVELHRTIESCEIAREGSVISSTSEKSSEIITSLQKTFRALLRHAGTLAAEAAPAGSLARRARATAMAMQTKITVETDSLLVLQGRIPVRAWCPRCGAEREMIPLNDLGVVSNLPAPEVQAWLESEDLHHTTTNDGAPLICLNSMLRRVHKPKRA